MRATRASQWSAALIVQMAVVVGTALAAATILLAEALPSFDIALETDGDRVVASSPTLPHTVVASLRSARGSVNLEAGDLRDEPDVLPDWNDYNRFFTRQQRLGEVVDGEGLMLVDAHGTAHPLMVTTRRAIDLPASFYAQLAVVLMI